MAANSAVWEQANELVETACKQDNNVRLKTGPQLILFLDGKGKLDGRQADQLIDAMTDWLQSSNFKISLMAIDVFNVLVFKLASIDRHSPTILSALLEALKTSNDQVREQIQHLLGAITDKCTPAVVADKICINGLTHKAWRVREETLVWIINTLEIHGKEGLQVSKFLSQVCNLVVDANVDVRDRAVQLLVEIYKHVGDRLKLDLEKKQLVPDASKRKVLFQKFEEAKANNLMKVANSPTSANGPGEINGEASSTLARVNGAVKSASNTAAASTTSSRPPGGGAVNRSNSVSSASGKTLAARKASTSGGGLPSGASSAGGIGTSEFQKSFDEIKPVTIYSARNLDEDLTKIKDTLENADNDWKVRVNEMKKLCSIFKANAFTNYPNDINNHLKDLTRVLSISVKDLRSQVSREACITVGYMCQTMGLSAAILAEGCLSNLFAIVPNSAKIIATSGCTALMYITQYVHSAKLIPSLLTFQSTKSIPCRLQLSRMLEDILRNWDSSVLDKYFTNVEDCMVKLLSDADEKTRSFARKSFFALKDRFPSRADILMGTLDPRVQRKLTGEGSYGSSVTSLAASMSQSSLGSQESLGGRSMSSVTRMGVKNSTNIKRTIGPGDRSKLRTSRAAQSQPASRSGSRGTSPQTARLNIMTSPTVVSSSSVTSPRASVATGIPAPSPASHHRTQLQDTTSLSYTPNAQRSQHSKIGSSPSSGLGTSLSSYNKRSAIRSLNTSRDHSPASSIGGTRSGNRSSIGSSGSHYSQQRSLQLTPQSASRFQKIQHERQHQLHQPQQSMRMLVDNPEAVKFVEHALMSTNHGSTSPYSVGAQRRPRYDSYGTALSDDDSDRCSLQSYDSRYDRDFENMAEVLEKCSAQNWSDRKEGLLSLQAALRSRQCQLNRQEIRKATEIFTRMFGDPHVKVLSLFLEVLADFVVTYFETLADWLSVLLPKLLQKTGAENLLNSGLMKVNRCLEIVREKFALDHQFVILMKYIADQTQTKSLKVKLALLKYLLSVIRELNSHEFVNSADTRQALQLVLTWSTDKNAEIRRNAVAVVTSLFDLNTAEFNALQNALPKKELQHLANNILHQYVNNFENNNNHNSSFSSATNIATAPTGNVNGSSSFLSTSGVTANSVVDTSYTPHANNYVLRSPLQQQQQQPPTSLNLSTQQRRGATGSSSNVSSPNQNNSAFNRTGPAAIPSLSGIGGPSPGGRQRRDSGGSSKSFGGGYSGGSGLNTVANSGRSSGGRARGAEYLDVDAAGDGGLGGGGGPGEDQLPRTPNSQQALLYKTTSDIHKYFDTQNNNAGSGEGYDSGIPSMPNSNVDLHGDLGSNNRIYDPTHYQDKSILESPDFIAKRPFDLDDDVDEFLSSSTRKHFSLTTPGSTAAVSLNNKDNDDVIEADADGDHIGGSRGESVNMMQQQEDEKLVEAILQELSHHNSRIEQRKSALISLTKLIKEGNAVVWEEHFKMCLMMLFETMSDKEPTIRALVLRVLREFLKHQQHRFQQYAEITILKTLDAHKDSHKDVVRASEELTYSVVNAIEHARCLQVLCPVVAAGDFPINQTAVKMLTKIIEDSPPEEVETFVEQVCPALMKAYEHQESSVRKDSVYGLVAVHQKVGQAMLDQYTNSLSHGKLKLLRLYISRAGGSGSGGASGTTGGGGGAGISTVSSGSGDKKSTSNHTSVAPSLNQPQQIGSTGAKN